MFAATGGVKTSPREMLHQTGDTCLTSLAGALGRERVFDIVITPSDAVNGCLKTEGSNFLMFANM